MWRSWTTYQEALEPVECLAGLPRFHHDLSSHLVFNFVSTLSVLVSIAEVFPCHLMQEGITCNR